MLHPGYELVPEIFEVTLAWANLGQRTLTLAMVIVTLLVFLFDPTYDQITELTGTGGRRIRLAPPCSPWGSS